MASGVASTRSKSIVRSLRDRSLPLRSGPRGSAARIRNQDRRTRRALGVCRLFARAGDGLSRRRQDIEQALAREGLAVLRRRRSSRIGLASPRIIATKKASRRNGAHVPSSMESPSSVILTIARAWAAPTSRPKKRNEPSARVSTKTPSARLLSIAALLRRERSSMRWGTLNSVRYEQKPSGSSEMDG